MGAGKVSASRVRTSPRLFIARVATPLWVLGIAEATLHRATIFILASPSTEPRLGFPVVVNHFSSRGTR